MNLSLDLTFGSFVTVNTRGGREVGTPGDWQVYISNEALTKQSTGTSFIYNIVISIWKITHYTSE